MEVPIRKSYFLVLYIIHLRVYMARGEFYFIVDYIDPVEKWSVVHARSISFLIIQYYYIIRAEPFGNYCLFYFGTLKSTDVFINI